MKLQPGDIVKTIWGDEVMIDKIYENFAATPNGISISRKDWLESQAAPYKEHELLEKWVHYICFNGGSGMCSISRLVKVPTEQGVIRPLKFNEN